jgi:hypothetical protein
MLSVIIGCPATMPSGESKTLPEPEVLTVTGTTVPEATVKWMVNSDCRPFPITWSPPEKKIDPGILVTLAVTPFARKPLAETPMRDETVVFGGMFPGVNVVVGL